MNAVANLYLEDLDAWLLHCQVCHFDVKTMEMDASYTLVDVLCELPFTQGANVFVIWKGTCLVKLTEELVDLIGRIVADELVPEAASFHLMSLTFVIVDDLLEVPREG